MTCAIEGCPKPVYTRRPNRGWCVTHYRRWADHGDPLVILNGHGVPLIERFLRRVVVTPGGCWEWTGVVNRYGYGHFSVPGGTRLAHRWSYEHHLGPVPEGVMLDHLCHSQTGCPLGACLHRRCVNPAHLEPVTAQENAARMARTKATCLRGHPLPPYVPGGRRPCRACAAAANKRWLERQRMATKAPRGSPGAG